VKRFALWTTLLAILVSICAGWMPASAGGPPSRPYWVFLRDRGPLTVDAAAVARRLPPEVWARRARAGSGLPDPLDLPLWEPYVREVAQFGRLRHRSHWLNAVSLDVPPEALSRIAALPCVAEMRPVAVAREASLGPPFDVLGRPLETSLSPWSGLPPAPGERDDHLRFDYGPAFDQLEEIGVTALHALGFYGSRVRFMMLDTGFRKDHHAFARARVLGEWDYVSEDGNVQNEPGDSSFQHHHGTGCWGAAGGYAPGSLIGPAFDAEFFLAKTEDILSETSAEEDNYVAALEWADTLGVSITSASLTYLRFDDGFTYTFEDKDGDTAVITRAVDIAASRGILCVNAIGNYGGDYGSLGTPSDADSIISVGAVDSLDLIAWFSACGPTYDGRTKPEVLARGVHTVWADANGPNSYGYANGTSLSTPLVSGAAALLMEAHPEWSAMDVRDALLATADRADSCDNQYGWGRIDAVAALNRSPLLYPMPFSLISPEDSAMVEVFQPTFMWHSTTDPDHGDSIAYTLWLEDSGDPEGRWEFPAGADTVLTLPFLLAGFQYYVWYVTAEDSEGNRRPSRETLRFIIDSALQTAPEQAAPAAVRLTCTPNPFAGAVGFRLPHASGSGASSDAVPRWSIYDALGRRVARGTTTATRAGYQGRWDGMTQRGDPAGPGVYYLEVRTGRRVLREPLVRIAP